MTATVVVEYWNGGSAGSPTKTSASTFRFRTDDSPATINTTNSLVKPTSGQNYSYWVHVALAISGTFTQVDNIRFYTDGTISWTLGSTGNVRIGTRDSGDEGCPVANYEPAAGTSGTTGYSLEDGTNGHDYYKSQSTPVTTATTFTSGSPATIDSTAHTSAESSKAVVLQVKIDNDATQGSQSSETFTLIYDEI